MFHVIKNIWWCYSMKYTTMSLILSSGLKVSAVLTMSSVLQIMVSLRVPHELFYALSIKTCHRSDKNKDIRTVQ